MLSFFPGNYFLLKEDDGDAVKASRSNISDNMLQHQLRSSEIGVFVLNYGLNCCGGPEVAGEYARVRLEKLRSRSRAPNLQNSERERVP